MKLRTDFVTNSSSSSFICLRLPTKNAAEILEKNDLSDEKIIQRMDDGDFDHISYIFRLRISCLSLARCINENPI